MSIYASLYYLPDEDSEETQPAPIVYHHSGHYPDPDERAGMLEIAGPPGHICGNHEDSYCPYLRFGVSEDIDEDGQTVVLDLKQVDGLIEALQEWRSHVVTET